MGREPRRPRRSSRRSWWRRARPVRIRRRSPRRSRSSDAAEAEALADAYVAAWSEGDHAAMYELLDPATRERLPARALRRAPRRPVRPVARRVGHAPRRPARQPWSGSRPSRGPARSPRRRRRLPPRRIPRRHRPSLRRPARASIPPRVLPGPVRGMAVPVRRRCRLRALRVTRRWIGRSRSCRVPTAGCVRWSPEVLFPELGSDGDLRLDRDLGPRGRIVGADGTVWAETREDGARVYPQEALAGQTIGYVTEVTAEDLESLAPEGYLAGDVVGPVGARGRPRGRAAGHARLAARGSRRPTARRPSSTRPRWCPAPTRRSPSIPSSRRSPRMGWPVAPARPRSWIPPAATCGPSPAVRPSTRTR